MIEAGAFVTTTALEVLDLTGNRLSADAFASTFLELRQLFALRIVNVARNPLACGSAPPAAAVYCAKERDNCACTGLVWYGAGERWTSQATVSTVLCGSEVFGDPWPGQPKECRCDPSLRDPTAPTYQWDPSRGMVQFLTCRGTGTVSASWSERSCYDRWSWSTNTSSPTAADTTDDSDGSALLPESDASEPGHDNDGSVAAVAAVIAVVVVVGLGVAAGVVLHCKRAAASTRRSDLEARVIDLATERFCQNHTHAVKRRNLFKACVLQWRIPPSRVQAHRSLGATSLVGSLQLPSSGRMGPLTSVVIRQQKVSSVDAAVNFLAEGLLQLALCHQNLVQFAGISVSADAVFRYEHFYAGGDLRTYIRACRPAVSSPREELGLEQLCRVSMQLCSAMAYLRDKGVVHRGLCAANVLVGADHRSIRVAQLERASDVYYFDASRGKKQNNNNNVGGGPKARQPAGGTGHRDMLRWMAPESVSDETYTYASDTWMLAMTLWEVLSFAMKPFGQLKDTEVLHGVRDGTLRPSQPPGCPPLLHGMLQQCWALSPEARPTPHDLHTILATQLHPDGGQLLDLIESASTIPTGPGYVLLRPGDAVLVEADGQHPVGATASADAAITDALVARQYLLGDRAVLGVPMSGVPPDDVPKLALLLATLSAPNLNRFVGVDVSSSLPVFFEELDVAGSLTAGLAYLAPEQRLDVATKLVYVLEYLGDNSFPLSHFDLTPCFTKSGSGLVAFRVSPLMLLAACDRSPAGGQMPPVWGDVVQTTRPVVPRAGFAALLGCGDSVGTSVSSATSTAVDQSPLHGFVATRTAASMSMDRGDDTIVLQALVSAARTSLAMPEINHDRLHRIRQLGEGAFGRVDLMVLMDSERDFGVQLVAAKYLRPTLDVLGSASADGTVENAFYVPSNDVGVDTGYALPPDAIDTDYAKPQAVPAVYNPAYQASAAEAGNDSDGYAMPTNDGGDLYELDRVTAAEELQREANMMLGLRHPNLVALLGVSTGAGTASAKVITEYLPGGSIEDWLVRHAHKITPFNRLRVMHGCALGLIGLHKHGIIHRDLAARNVLLGQNFTIKLADFGLSRDPFRTAENEDVYYTMSGSTMLPMRWLAPEIPFNGFRFTLDTDVYAFGILVYEIMTGKAPLAGLRDRELGELWTSKDRTMASALTWPEGSGSAGSKDLVATCTDRIAASRPTAGQLVRRCLGLLVQNAPPADRHISDMPATLVLGRRDRFIEGMENDDDDDDDNDRDGSCV